MLRSASAARTDEGVSAAAAGSSGATGRPPHPTRAVLYEQLDAGRGEIRALPFAGGHLRTSGIEAEDTIVLNLHTISASDPLYNALSYVWGRPEFDQQATINGFGIHVTENLFLALRDLRASGSVVRWWVDAVCINQAEKVAIRHWKG
jgi:hypothetical protein